MVVHTREGHEPNLTDCPTCKVHRLVPFPWIDDNGSSVAYTPSQCPGFKTYYGDRGTRPKGQPFACPGRIVSPGKTAFQQLLIIL